VDNNQADKSYLVDYSFSGAKVGLVIRTMLDDASSLRLYPEGRSEDAFTELVRRHFNLVYFTALRRVGGDPHRAKEVAQDASSILVSP